MLDWALAVGWLALAGGIAQLIGPRIWTYRVDREGVAYLLFNRFRLWRIPYQQIASAEVMSWLDAVFDESLRGFKVLTLPNRVFGWYAVVVRRTNGRAVVLTPSDPDGFVRAVTERLSWSARNGLEDGGTPALQPAALDMTLPARSRSEDTQSSLRRKES